MPAFQDDDIEKWFQVFEKAALSAKWPKSSWVLLLQSRMKGKAQEAFAALPASEIGDYQNVKKTILLKYSLVPEAYRQKYRELKKKDNETYAGFAYESELLFDRWCTSVEVGTDFDKMRPLILVEQFRNSVSSDISVYLNEKEVSNLRDAGVKADEFALIHKRSNIHKKVWVKGSPSSGDFNSKTYEKSGGSSRNTQNDSDKLKKYEKLPCWFCKAIGHPYFKCKKWEEAGKPTMSQAWGQSTRYFGTLVLEYRFCSTRRYSVLVLLKSTCTRTCTQVLLKIKVLLTSTYEYFTSTSHLKLIQNSSQSNHKSSLRDMEHSVYDSFSIRLAIILKNDLLNTL